jgi:hypothetical protein
MEHSDTLERLARTLPEQTTVEVNVEDTEAASSFERSHQTRLETLDGDGPVPRKGNLEI